MRDPLESQAPSPACVHTGLPYTCAWGIHPIFPEILTSILIWANDRPQTHPAFVMWQAQAVHLCLHPQRKLPYCPISQMGKLWTMKENQVRRQSSNPHCLLLGLSWKGLKGRVPSPLLKGLCFFRTKRGAGLSIYNPGRMAVISSVWLKCSGMSHSTCKVTVFTFPGFWKTG
jgi:hypothetical protein